jgi:hypothetical protein
MQDSQAGHLRGAPVRAPGIQRRASKFPEPREIVRLRGLTPETKVETDPFYFVRLRGLTPETAPRDSG